VDLQGDPAADRGDRVAGELDQVEVIDSEPRVRQRGPHRLRLRHARVQGHHLHRSPERRTAGAQPLDHRGAGPPGDLPEACRLVHAELAVVITCLRVRQRLAEQRGEQERREVVDLEGQLVPVAGDNARSGGDQPGVVDQDVDPRVPGCQLPGELANLIEMREVGDVPIRAQFAGDCAGFRGRSPDRPPPPPRRRARSAIEQRRRRFHRWRRSPPSCSHAWLAFLLNRPRVTSRTPTVAPRGRRNRSRRCRR
jgi:hypothetical protein